MVENKICFDNGDFVSFGLNSDFEVDEICIEKKKIDKLIVKMKFTPESLQIPRKFYFSEQPPNVVYFEDVFNDLEDKTAPTLGVSTNEATHMIH